MKIWDILLTELSSLPKTLESIHIIIKNHFNNNIFCEEYVNNAILKTTHNEIFNQSNRVANYIIDKLGLPNKGDVIFLQDVNSKNWIICFWGILQSGYIPVCVDPAMNEEHFQYIYKKLAPELIINSKNIIEITKCNVKKQFNITFANSFILLTSGTTNLPKIVEFNGESVYAQLLLARDIIKKSWLISNFKQIEKIKLLMFLPLHHVFGLMANYLWFVFYGTKFVFIKSMNPDEIQFACRRHKVTHFLGVPIVWETIAKKIWLEADKQNRRKILERAIKLTNALQTIFPRFGFWLTKKIFKNLRREILGDALFFLISGGASIDAKTLKLMNGLGYTLHQGYGMTEVGIVSVELSTRASKRNLLSVGKAFNNIEWRINKDEVLELKTPMLAKKIISGDHVVEFNNKWFVTKDMFINKHGRLLMLGRADDIIIGREGIKINPEEIENKFPFNDGRCTVIPHRLPSGYDKIILVIQISNTISKTSRNEITYQTFKAIKDLPIDKKPREVYSIDKLPLTNLGKVKRVTVKEMFIKSPELFTRIENNVDVNAMKQQHSHELNEAINIVKQCYAEVLHLNIKQIDEHTDFILDLGGTSLDYYALLNKISLITNKQISLINNKTLTTPLDFALLLIKTR